MDYRPFVLSESKDDGNSRISHTRLWFDELTTNGSSCCLAPLVDDVMDRRLFHVGSHPGRAMRPILRYDAYGFFGVLYSTSFWNGFQMVS